MRTILALAILATSLMLGGCFHHNQDVYAEPLPAPPVERSIK
jgi:protein involved in sex pheromone biosynthesis